MLRILAAASVAVLAACGSPAAMDHIHAVTITEDGVFVGTHNGLWQVSEDAPPTQVSAQEWDIMGLAHDGVDFVASGHPGPGMNAPGNLGLQRSTDSGSTWSGVSLVGEVDFHHLAAQGDTVAGIDSHTGLVLTSADRGERWRVLESGQFTDVAVLADGDIVGVSGNARWRSVDGGQSWEQITVDTVTPVVVTAAGAELVAIDSEGRLLRASSWDAPWQVTETAFGRVEWVAALGDVIAVVANGRVLISRDGGAEFTAAVT
jgi:hypothetical protein